MDDLHINDSIIRPGDPVIRRLQSGKGLRGRFLQLDTEPGRALVLYGEDHVASAPIASLEATKD